MPRRLLATVAVSALAVTALAGCATDPDVVPSVQQPGAGRVESPRTPGGRPGPVVAVPRTAQAAVVVRHVDGDTVWLRGSGSGPLRPDTDTKVRILEVDTPEVTGPAECFGREASAFTARLLPVGSMVRVEADREPRDRFGRALLYLWTDAGIFVEEALLRDGYARAVVFGRNDRYIRQLTAVESGAREARRGLWGACAPS